MTPHQPDEPPADSTTRSVPLGHPAAPVPDGATYPLVDQSPVPPRRRRTGLIVGLVMAVVLVAAGAVAVAYVAFPRVVPAQLQRPQSFTTTGIFTILDGCSGWGYSDIHDGTEVQVTDAAGRVLAYGQLLSSGSCQWTFQVKGVPPGQRIYGVSVSHRGTVHFSEDQMRSGIELSLGG